MVDPPRRSRIAAVFHVLATILLFLPRLVVRFILHEIYAFTVRFQEPPIVDRLPNPPPKVRGGNLALEPDEVVEQIAHDLFLVPPHRLAGLLALVTLLYDSRRDGIDARRDLRVLFHLSRSVDDLNVLVPLGFVRRKLPEITRRDLNDALTRLENEKWIELVDKAGDDENLVRNGFRAESGQIVTHLRLLKWL